ncbi:MAG: hypothetical protein JWM76_3646 [Pseudonocardiales bacterium]|nr:hypothetical protein [Pseudonocardiales bacterium]
MSLVLALVMPFSLVATVVALAPIASADPANPTDAEIAAAAAAKDQAAKDVGRLSGLIAAADAEIVHLDGLAELAKEKYLKAIWDLAEAKDKAVAAQAAVQTAKKSVDDAKTKYRLFIQAQYMNRGNDSSLLGSEDPTTLLARNDLTSYTAGRQVTAISELSRATVSQSNADAAARSAVDAQTAATAAASTAQESAVSAANTAKAQKAVLDAQNVVYQAQLDAAGMALTGLQDQRAAYVAWQAEQARIAAEAAARAEAQRQAQIAAQKAAAATKTNTNTGNSSSGGSSGTTKSVIASGGWTAAKGQAAANRALQWLGEKYSFAAGNYDGPTWGACVTNDSGWNDCHVFGFDCSGLAMYAWSPAGIRMPHYAASQYYYGSFHPNLNQLMPGDLLFWSSDRTIPGIHHVAIYIGNGQVVQAPQSGDVVKISNIWSDEYYGATRPGS